MLVEEIWYTGKVKFFNHKSKFGFIIVDQTKQEIYVHRKNCEDELNENDNVSFTIEQVKRGPAATQVKKIDLNEQ